LDCTCRGGEGAGLGSGAVQGGAGRGGASAKGRGRRGEARTEMSLPTYSRLFIVSEVRVLALPDNCRGGEGAGLGSGAWRAVREGGRQCGGAEGERRARRCLRPRPAG